MYNTVWWAYGDVLHRLRTVMSGNDLFNELFSTLWHFMELSI